ncbi:MAG: YidC/Oxa1 family membrane protein insertase, partial [Spirochaetota bacterium]
METLISPLSTLLRLGLENFYTATSNYALAIILLSIGVSLILLPIQIWADKIQEKEQAHKARMRYELSEIKDTVPNSQERYFYTRYIYRLYNYHPIFALRGLAGLLIQVPFFIAAYMTLEHFNGFTGQSFGFIQDLSQPDKLLLGMNILPFGMTLFNVLSAWAYLQKKQEHHSEPSQTLQLYTISILFLFLLYNKSSALLLYWTCNN